MDRQTEEMFERLEQSLSAPPKYLTDEEKVEVLKKAEKDALYGFYKSLFMRQYITDFMTDGKTPLEHLESNSQKVIIDRAMNAVQSKSNYCFLTVNAYPHISQDILTKSVNKFVNRKGIVSSYFYVYEVRKPNYDGLHCHIIFYRKGKPNDIKRGAQSTFKDICNVSHPEILNIKYPSEDIIQDKISYLLGEKKESKQKGVEATIAYRTEYNLCPYYESTPPLPCRGAEKILNTPNVD